LPTQSAVLWEVTLEATIVGVEFKKCIIHSIAALTYQQGQSLIDNLIRDDMQAGGQDVPPHGQENPLV
jgi:exosome complex exonuclease DIS3/RRP44